jgi:hypothetical protein
MRLLFNELEKDPQRNQAYLITMFELIKLVLNYSDMELLSELLSDEYFIFTFGCLECNCNTNSDDPPFLNSPIKHREFLKKQAKFTEVIPIRNR